MKFYNLYIHFENNIETYQAVTKILGVNPKEQSKSKHKIDIFDTWWYQVEENENESTYDFINNFLDLIEPNFEELSKLNISKSNILIWLIYEYDQQCALEFHSQELKRLGESGIGFNIDCFQFKETKSRP